MDARGDYRMDASGDYSVAAVDTHGRLLVKCPRCSRLGTGVLGPATEINVTYVP